MSTYTQVGRGCRKRPRRRFKLLALNGAPMKRGVCRKLRVIKPKKPNSAQRKIVKVKLSNDRFILSYIPGQGHTLQEYSVVLVRGGRVKDLPGIRFHLVRGPYDFSWHENIYRKHARSKYGAPLENRGDKDEKEKKEK